MSQIVSLAWQAGGRTTLESVIPHMLDDAVSHIHNFPGKCAEGRRVVGQKTETSLVRVSPILLTMISGCNTIARLETYQSFVAGGPSMCP